jgi:probable HAF family extracellular repeat protein
LGALPSGPFSPSSLAWGVNASGQVVGDSGSSSGQPHAFLYTGGAMTDLGTLGGNPYSFAFGINASGQIVGESGPDPGTAKHAFLYSNGVMRDLGTLGGSYSSARGINDVGQVIGYSATADGSLQAFLYSNGSMTALGAFTANAINSAGQIAAPQGATPSSTRTAP